MRRLNEKKTFFLITILSLIFLVINSNITVSSIEKIDVSLTIVNGSFQENAEQTPTTSRSGDSTTKIKKEEISEKKCKEQWICTDWSECINRVQSIECFDYNNCGTKLDQPPLERTCKLQESSQEMPTQEQPKSYNDLIGIIIILLIILSLIHQMIKSKAKYIKKGKK